MKTALYAGSFDPITNGHLNIIERSLKIFDKLVIVVANNSRKQDRLFSLEECKQQIEEVYGQCNQVKVVSSSNLIADEFKKYGAVVLIRGLRTISDFEYELAMQAMNKKLYSGCETLFFMPSPETSFVSSTMIKEIALNKGDISSFVPPIVWREFKKKFLSKE